MIKAQKDDSLVADLEQRELVVDEDGKPGHRNHKELHSERVVTVVVRRAELGIHQIYCGVRRDDEEDLHDRVVQRHERREQVQIARREYHRKHYL